MTFNHRQNPHGVLLNAAGGTKSREQHSGIFIRLRMQADEHV